MRYNKTGGRPPEIFMKSGRTPRVSTNWRDSVVAVVGLGYVGLPLAILAARKGYTVRGYDIDERKIKKFATRDASFLTEEEQKQFKQLDDFAASTDESILAFADSYIICVPTPVDEEFEPDLTPLIRASEAVGQSLTRDALVIVESTVNPGVCENTVLPILERLSGLKAEDGFFFAHCPERINPGDTEWNVRTIPRVLGASGPRSLLKAYALYSTIIDGQLFPMRTLKEAEAVKMVENSFRDINIAFVNELAMAFSKAGIDIVNVLTGASTKPFAFMPHFPGCGVGGHCIPVDPYYLIRYGRENGFEHDFLKQARKINNGMPGYLVNELKQALKERKRPLKNAQIALLGLAYKKDIGDLRESPALHIRELLEKAGAKVRVYDPYVQEQSTVDTLSQAMDGADAVLIATDHTEFRNLSPGAFDQHGVDLVVDGRNCLPREAFEDTGITYRGIGR